MKRILGVDIGGTKISLILATPQGKIIRKEKLKTKLNRKAADSIGELLAVLKQLGSLEKGARVQGIGVGIPGAIDHVKGSIIYSPNLPGWKGIPIRDLIRKKIKAPVYLENDANVACLGEKVFGSGKAYQNFIYVTISTGIGGGIIVNNQLVRGADGFAGEVGQMIIDPHGYRGNDGRYGSLESHASGTALANLAKKELRKLSKTSLQKNRIFQEAKKSIANVDAFAIEQAAKKKDKLALSLFRQMGNDLGLGMSHLVFCLNPQAIIFGGSVTKAFSIFVPSFRKSLRKHTWPSLLKNLKIHKTTLGDNIADFGTLALVLEHQ